MTTHSKEIVTDPALIARCGLYCGACPIYLKGKCPGCTANTKAEKWCKVRTCTLQNGYSSCAECRQTTAAACKIYNNPVSKFFSFIFRSNRQACIARIAEVGPQTFAAEMASRRKASLPR